MAICIIDYGMGNLFSVRRALEECGADVIIAEHPQDLLKASHIILPGVGAFADGMANLRQNGWDIAIRESGQRNVPLLGICLGMQLLFTEGEEGGIHSGLDIIQGTVRKFQSTNSSERIPHVGWNNVKILYNSELVQNIQDDSDFYFVHSYYVDPLHKEDVVGLTEYCGKFASIVQKGSTFGAQFHPEKSGKNGYQLLRNFIGL